MNNEDRDLLVRWAAGFFDGEGSVFIRVERRRKPSWQPTTRLVVSVGNTDPRPVERFSALFGGVVRTCIHASGGRRVLFVWSISGKTAYWMCKEVQPFVVNKAEQVACGIAFYEKPWRRNRRTGSEVASDLMLADEVKRLKNVTYETHPAAARALIRRSVHGAYQSEKEAR